MKLSIFNRIGLTLFVLKTAIATGLAWLLAASLSHNHYPYFAALGAVLTVQLTIVDSINKAMQRIIGVIGGVVVSIIVGHWLPLNFATITLVVFIGMAFSTALRLHPQIISQVAVSSLLVLAFGKTHGYAIDRIIETAIGCGIAVVVNLVVIPPNPIPIAEQRILHLGEYATTVLQDLAFAYQEQSLRPVDMPYVQELVDDTEQALQDVRLAHQSLRYSPLLRSRRSRVSTLSNIILRFERITIQIRGIARGLVDLGLEAQPNDGFIEAMRSTASCIHLVARQEISGSHDLGNSLREAFDKAQDCQNLSLKQLKDIPSLETLREFGSMLTDLHRILDELEGTANHITGGDGAVG